VPRAGAQGVPPRLGGALRVALPGAASKPVKSLRESRGGPGNQLARRVPNGQEESWEGTVFVAAFRGQEVIP
jgi:hypothetical protein